MHEEFNPALLIPLAAIALPMVLVPTIMAMKQKQRKREWEHLERMKALELGRPLPSTQVWPALAAIAIGAIMPIGVFFIAWLASLQGARNPETFFGPAAFVSVCGIWAGATLGRKLAADRASKSIGVEPYDKQTVDPETFDFVGRRG